MLWNLAQVFTSDWMMELMEHVPVLVLRTVITFVVIVFVVRWTGKRSISNLAPFDLALVIIIGEVAAIPVADLDVDLLHGILPVCLLGGMHVLMTTINMHSKTLEELTEGNPTLLVKDGRVLRKNLLKERVSMADLKTALRHKEITEMDQVKEAWIEQAGGISVIRKHHTDEPELDPSGADSRLEAAIERIVEANVARMRQELAELIANQGKAGG